MFNVIFLSNSNQKQSNFKFSDQYSGRQNKSDRKENNSNGNSKPRKTPKGHKRDKNKQLIVTDEDLTNIK